MAEKLHAPVTLSLMGMGAFPTDHELFTGMIGMHGTKTSNLAVTECDLLIAIGARSGGLGTMGFGLGASIGAQIAKPEKRVFNIAGDGSFRMNLNELATAVEYNLPIIVVIMNNHALGMVRQWLLLLIVRLIKI